jgi:cytochrome c oxidase subunit IV
MSSAHRHALFCWVALVLLAAAELVGSFAHVGRSARDLLLIPALVMVFLVGLMFMRLRRAPHLAHGFALAGLLWLLLLLGLGTMDPMTRAVYPVNGSELSHAPPVPSSWVGRTN